MQVQELFFFSSFQEPKSYKIQLFVYIFDKYIHKCLLHIPNNLKYE